MFLKSVPHIQKVLNLLPHEPWQGWEHAVLSYRDGIQEQGTFCGGGNQITPSYGQKK